MYTITAKSSNVVHEDDALALTIGESSMTIFENTGVSKGFAETENLFNFVPLYNLLLYFEMLFATPNISLAKRLSL